MNIIEMKEQKHFNFRNFQSIVRQYGEFSDEVLRDILKRLELSHCLKHFIPRQDVPDEIEMDDLMEDKSEHYKFTYVGIVLIRDFCFIIYPKYWAHDFRNEIKKVEKFSQILKVIEKYQSNHASYLTVSNEYGKSKLSMMITLLQDYLENGLYSNDAVMIKENGEGQILWEKTINESQAYVSDGTPVYLDLYTQTTVLNELDIVRRIHAAIVSEIGRKIREILPHIGLDFDFQISDEDSVDFGDTEHLLYLIEREFSKQFVTSKQVMLRNLKNYLEEEAYESNDEVQLYGTASFNLVWEAVCAAVYRNSLEMDMRSLGLHRNANYDNSDVPDSKREIKWKTLKLGNFVEKPVWVHATDNKRIKASKTLLLDVLDVDLTTKTFRIFDAKYYLLRFEEDANGTMTIKGQPGVGDITKQYLYQLAYKELAEENGYGFTNGFIIPKDDLVEGDDIGHGLGIGKLLGIAEMRMLNQLSLKNIMVIGRDCYTMFQQYLRI
ncbi:LlaJI family restriction endonuclease [Gottfriedia acidiceleris]|uniref:LlaJI family restriction endonuclease n=1 Tax=Gottfriedia acidiceleris TaxID=371036 RepID=UPI003390F8CF